MLCMMTVDSDNQFKAGKSMIMEIMMRSVMMVMLMKVMMIFNAYNDDNDYVMDD